MSQYSWATCPESVTAQIQQLREHVQNILGTNFVGLYLHGSLALGCFNPLQSDIDLLVVTDQVMRTDIKYQIAKLLLGASMAPTAIEISFLVKSIISPFQHPLPYDLHYSEDWREDFTSALQTGAWRTWNDEPHTDVDLTAHVTITVNRGVCLYGRPIKEVFPDVPTHYYRTALLTDFDWSLPQATIIPTYFILNACRTCAYLQEGSILSKDEGGTWGLRVLPPQFHKLIQQALNVYRGDGEVQKYQPRALDTFVNYMQERIKREA